MPESFNVTTQEFLLILMTKYQNLKIFHCNVEESEQIEKIMQNKYIKLKNKQMWRYKRKILKIVE